MAGAKEAKTSLNKRRGAGKARRASASVMKPEYLAELERMRLMDDDFMSKCLEDAPECIELMLRIILSKKDLKVVTSQTEYPIKSLQGRGVRFDVFARDSDGREYDIEIQRSKYGAEPKRARYNSALMDANALKSGEDIGKLRDTYVIFITENDEMKRGKDVYVFNRVDKDDGLELHDGTHIIYVNGATRSATEIGRLVHDLRCRDAAKMHFDVLRKRVSQFKNSEEGRYYMCEAFERLEARGVRKGRAEGRAEGRRENMIETAIRMLKDGVLALKDIARYSGLSLAQVRKLQAGIQPLNPILP